ncbi:hypothetical protein LJB96_05340 [Methanobrevibacter sp. OttesenSCG-928-K11]|nr:hypothetical protein [Methanobrevibacter sp. OttesenSCG-928-K11]
MTSKKIKIFTPMILLFIVLTLSLSTVSAETHVLGNFTNLQEAINNVGTDNTIILDGDVQLIGSESGTFSEGIEIDKNNIIIDGKGFKINGTSVDGIGVRIFKITGNNVILKNITLTGGYMDPSLGNNGGAIINFGNNTTLEDVNITNNIADLGGGIYNLGTGFTITGNSFITNNQASSGGGIYNQAENFKIIGENIIFDNSAIDGVGGGICSVGNNFTISGENIIFNNFAGYSGGGIYTNGNYFTITGENIIANNSAEYDGGGIYNYYGTYFLIEGKNIIANNSAGNDGGGIICNYFSRPNYYFLEHLRIMPLILITNSFLLIYGNNIIANNSAENDGGGIHYILGINFTIFGNNSFINNSAGHYGGGIYYDYSFNLTIFGNNSFINNSATENGGAIYNTGATNISIIGNNTLISNKASHGGAIYNWYVNDFLIYGNNNLSNNFAQEFGGAFLSLDGNFKIEGNNIFSYNEASFGGAIFSDSTNSTITGNNLIFTNTAYSIGGAIYNGGDNLTISGFNEIFNNSAKEGGAIYNIAFNFDSQYGIILTGNNLIYNNRASEKGGAIYNDVDGTFIIEGNSFINNTADNSKFGTAIYNSANLSSSNAKFDGTSHFIYNDVGAILFLNNNSMSSNYIEKIYNLGYISSTVNVIYLDNKTIKVPFDDDVIVNGQITDDVGNVIVGQNLSFIITDSSGNLVLDENISTFKDGYYHVIFNVNNYTHYFVNGTYVPANHTIHKIGIIKVLIRTFTTINNVTGKPGESVIINGTVVDEKGVLVNGNVTLNLADGSKVIVPVINGKFSYTWTIPKTHIPGEYDMSAVYDGNETHFGSNATGIATVYKLKTITTINNVTGKPGESVIIKGTVVDENGVLVNGNVTLNLADGKTVVVPVINGKFSYTWTIPKTHTPGEYDMSAVYDGNETHFGSNATGIATVYKLKTITTINNVTGKPGDSVIIKGTVIDENGDKVTGNVTLTLADGSKVIVSVIDGVFEYTWAIPNDFKQGNYPINAIFDENYYYYGSNATGNLLVVYVPGPTPNPDPKPTPNPEFDEGKQKTNILTNNMEKAGNPILILLLVVISGLIIPLKRRK